MSASARVAWLANRQRIRTLSCHSKRRLLHSVPHYDDYDVLIVGGGPAGLALASVLGSYRNVRESLRIALVEAGDLSKVHDWDPPAGQFSNRVSSITNVSQKFIADIGAWIHVDGTRTTPIEEMQVWDGVSGARITFNSSDLGLTSVDNSSYPSQMARLTENLNLQRAFLRQLSGMEHIKLIDRVKVSSIVREDRDGGSGWPLVHLSDGRVIRTRLLVGADGFNSPVRAYAGISSYGWSYDTQAIVATLEHAPRGAFEPPNTVAYQRFLPTGPIAFLPLSPTTSSLVWSTKPRLAAALTTAHPAVLVSMINAAFRLPEVSMRYLHNVVLAAQNAGTAVSPDEIKAEIVWRERSHAIDEHSAYASATFSLGSVGIPPADSDTLPPLVTSIQLESTASFPLRFNHADAYIGEGSGSRTVLVGDAAHTVHPLAGQGLNMGLADVASLAQCIHQAVLQGGDIGSYTALMPYAQERYFGNHKLMAAVDKLHKLYSSTFEPIVWARSVGLEVVNEFDSIKAAIMMSAGADARMFQAGGWDIAAKGIEALSGSLSTGKIIGEGLVGMMGTGLQNLLRLQEKSRVK